MSKVTRRSMLMPFGKHKGTRLDEIPEEYLHWVLENCERLDQRLRESIRAIVAPVGPQPNGGLRLETARTLNGIRDEVQRAFREILIEYRFDNDDSFLAIEALDKFNEAVQRILAERLGSA
jgi:hypothetical protein